MGRGFPPPKPTRGSGGSVVSSPAGSGEEPRSKLNFYTVWMRKKPSGLVTRIAQNFHSKQRLSLLRKTTVIQITW